MSNRYEYEQFWTKFLKNAQDLQQEFNQLSDENKWLVAQRLSELLKGYGLLLAAEEILRNCTK